jgi:hypothetical protein
MLVSDNVGTLVYCRTADHVTLVQRLQQFGHISSRVTYVRDGLNIDRCTLPDDVSVVHAYNMHSVELVDLWWQLPNLSSYDQTVFIDLDWYSCISTPLLESLVGTDQGVIQSAATSPSIACEKSHLLSLNPYVMVFDKSQHTWDFFTAIRMIANNWERVAVARLHESHRAKSLESILAIATEIVFGDKVDTLSPAYPTTQLQVLPTTVFQNGTQLKQTHLIYDLLRGN